MGLLEKKSKQAFTDPLSANNPITLQVLGICSALAVTVKMDTAVVMTLAVVAVLSISNTLISLLRNLIPGNSPGKSFLDGLGNALGYGGILIVVSFFREILGSGTIYGYQIIPDSAYAAGYENMGLMSLSPGAFIILGLIVWIQRISADIEEV